MKRILIELNKNQTELANKVKSLNCEIKEMTISHFNADPTIMSFLIVVTPVVVTQLGKIIRTIISTPSNGKVKIEGLEIEGFSYEETVSLLSIIAKNNEKEMANTDCSVNDISKE